MINIVGLPPGPLKGIDDYLLEHSVEEFKALPTIEVKTLSEKVSEATVENYNPILREISEVNDGIQRELFCKALSKRLKISVEVVRREIEKLAKDEKANDENFIVEDVLPCEDVVKGNELLNEIYRVIDKHIILEEKHKTACALWIVLTYCYDSFPILPILSITSPEKRCGKTTLLEILGSLGNKTLLASNITPSAVFRVVEKFNPCLLIDEADTFLKDNEELRGILNSGHTRKSAFVIRTNTVTLDPERFSTWGPKAIALIGELKDTLADRSVPIKLKRKTVFESIEKLPLDADEKCLHLRGMAKRWTNDNVKTLKGIESILPEVGNDRATDNWTPLIKIADCAGGEWPDRARKAMLAIEQVSDEDTIKQLLLRDIKEIFGTREKMSSKELVEGLIEIEDHPWNEWRRGKPLSQNGLSRLLKPFEISSNTIRFETNRAKGYLLNQFEDAFKRYLPRDTPIQSVTTLRSANTNTLCNFQSVTQKDIVTDEKRRKSTPILNSHGVTDEKRVSEGNKKKESLSIDEVNLLTNEITEESFSFENKKVMRV